MLYHSGSLHWRWTLYVLHGIILLERLRFSREEIHRRHTNNPELGGSPVARAYSRRQGRELFDRHFVEVHVSIHDQPRAMSFFPSKRLPLFALLPGFVKRFMARRFGFHLWVDARR